MLAPCFLFTPPHQASFTTIQQSLCSNAPPQGLCACSQSWFSPLNSCMGLIVLPHPTPLPRLLAPLLCFNLHTALIILHHPQGLVLVTTGSLSLPHLTQMWDLSSHFAPLPCPGCSHLCFVLTHMWPSLSCFTLKAFVLTPSLSLLHLAHM